MTLCIAWRYRGRIHLAADSRLTLAENSWADVGIKVLSIPYTILNPSSDEQPEPTVLHTGTVGLCFAGSAISSLTVKETVADALARLQYFPGFSDTSLSGIADFVFVVYRHISRRVCETALGPRGLADMVLAGYCPERRHDRAFRLSTDPQTNIPTLEEILVGDAPAVLIGARDAALHARTLLSASPPPRSPLHVLRDIARDDRFATVGGAVQMGETRGTGFVISGELARGKGVSYWRGGVDFNHPDFFSGGPLIPALPLIDFNDA